MSNTHLEPCTRMRNAGRDLYFRPLRHLSFALTPATGMIGRTGTAVCGQRGVVDQERATHLVQRQHPWRNIKIHELNPCRRCLSFLQR